MSKNIFEDKNSEKGLFLNRDAITPHYLPKKLPFRETQIDEMVNVLGVALKEQKPDNLFIYGKTGTGKTSTTNHVLSHLKKFNKENKNITSVYMNCRNYNSKYKVFSKIVKEFFPEKEFLGYSSTFIYEQTMKYTEDNSARIIIALDEIDKIKDLDDLVYSLSRSNDELTKGSISIIGISNQVNFKDKLGPRTKSSLCEQELLFPPYNAKELTKILKERIKLAFNPGVVDGSAISLASAIAAKESGDARTAVMLLLRAGELAQKNKLEKITDEEVKKAKKKVEEEIIYNMISTLPDQEQLVLYAIASLSNEKRGMQTLSGEKEKGVLFSGEIYDEYKKLAKKVKESVVSTRWFRQYINELEMHGLVLVSSSGKGYRGQTRLIKLGHEPKKIKEILEKEIVSD